MAHGITLELREITRPEPEYVKRYVADWAKLNDWTPLTEGSRDRTLSGKARIRARKAEAAEVRRTWFFKGHGWAGANDFNIAYDCRAEGCGFGIIAPLDDFDFMTDVMDHEQEHNEEVSA